LSDSTRICFVCLGNIVRSPLAESMFRHLAEQAGLGHKYEVDSAGTSGWHVGEEPDRRMRRVAAEHGFRYTGRSRQVIKRDFIEFDWIIAMDASNHADLAQLADSETARQKIRLMREFDPQGGPNAPVPDPYYGGIDGFEEVFQIVQRACQGLLDALEQGVMNSEG
jgi:protein-tyrosine phosphatase